MTGRSKAGEGTLTLVLVLSALALLTSLYLNHLHYKVHTDSSFSSFCALSREVNCETVALSPYSVFMGLPISYWGITINVLYIIVSGLGLMDTRRGRPARGFGLLSVMAVTGTVISAMLFYVAHFLIKSMCPFCIGIYILNIGIAVTIAIHVFRRHRNLAEMFRTDLRSLASAWALLLAIPALMVAGGLVVYPRIYDTGTCPGEKDEDLCTEPSTYGNPGARIRIVEYSDYQCPFCGMTHFSLRRAVETYPEDVVLVHVNFPLDRACNDLLDNPFHEDACNAARAAVCAQRQGRFWDYNDYLFTHQKQIGSIPYDKIASGMGLDVKAFRRCMEDPRSLEEVMADIQKAKLTDSVQRGQVGTPIITIDGKEHMGAIHWEDLDLYLRQSFGLVPKDEEKP